MRALIVAALIAFGVGEAGAALPFASGNPPGQRYLVSGSTVSQSSPLYVKSTSTTAGYKIFDVLNAAGTSLFQVLQNGFVGLGITPISKLHIQDGDVRISGTGDEVIFSGPQNGQVGHDGFFDLSFYTNGVTRLLITAAGNVVVGASSSSAKFHVKTASADRNLQVTELSGFLSVIARNTADNGYVRLNLEGDTLNLNANSGANINVGGALNLNTNVTSNFHANFSSSAVTGTNGANTFVSNTGECATSTTTITTNGGDLRVTFTGAADSGGVDTAVGVGFLVNGAYVLGQTSTTGITRSVSPSASVAGNLSFSRRVRGLAAGTYDVCIYFRAPTTTASGLSPDEAVLELEEIR